MKKFLLIIIILVITLGTVLSTYYFIKMKKTASLSPPDGIPYIIVLGAKVNGEELSKALKFRAEVALEYWKKNKNAKIVVTGGQGRGEEKTEASVLKRFFMDNGVDAEAILVEDQSTNTYENIQFSKKLYPIDKAIVVSNDFHLYRAITIAEKEGIEAYPLAAKTPTTAKIPLYMREFAAIVKMKILGY